MTLSKDEQVSLTTALGRALEAFYSFSSIILAAVAASFSRSRRDLCGFMFAKTSSKDMDENFFSVVSLALSSY